MRDDSRVEFGIMYTSLAVVLLGYDLVEVLWRSRRDPDWETRWKALEPTESVWLAEMARKREWLATLSDPEEIALAEGFRRHERRYALFADMALAPLLLAAGLLVIVGLVPIGTLGLISGAAVLVRTFVLYRRERRALKDYRQAKDTYGLLSGAPTSTVQNRPAT